MDIYNCGIAIYRCQEKKKMYDRVASKQDEKHQRVMQQMMHKFEVLQSPRTARNLSRGADNVIGSVLP